ncbi:helix-turn-helix transcriptional regulator [Rhizocola hellebori]|nr:helix-turn-helix transcriptional regulator [Rhizocola hellebori]
MLGHISSMFRHRWDPYVITALAGQPLRYRALSVNLQTQAGEHLDDSTLTRSLRRLIRSGLVTADNQRLGERDINLYRLTNQGREHLAAYRSLSATYEQHAAGQNSDPARGIQPHHPQSA